MNDTRSIAIIGYACRFPGADDAEQFWNNLSEGREAISFFTREDLLSSGLDAELIDRPNYVMAKGVLTGADTFDAGFFGMTPREAEILDPQQRVLLECAWTALEHAGCARVPDDNRIGVYLGAGLETYLPLNVLRNPKVLNAIGIFQAITNNSRDTVATRIAHRLNLKGPALTVQTACSTSLVTVHLGCQALISGEADITVAGGVKIGLPLSSGYLYEEGGILARDGHTRSFDSAASGCVLGDGVGIVVLKRLQDALADRDSIHAIIRGSSVLNDGSNKNSFTAPSIEGQLRTIRAAFKAANLDPRLVSYVEAHGSGTKVGDPAELSALQTALQRKVSGEHLHPLAVGSVKSNIGHLDTAAGIAGLLKVVLALENQTLPPSLHFTNPNPLFDWNGLFIVKETQSWKRFDPAIPLYASVNSLGIGGTNAHVVLEQAPPAPAAARSAESYFVPIAAHGRETLRVACNRLSAFLEQRPSLAFNDVARSLQHRRTDFGFRIGLVARSRTDLIRGLRTQEIDAAAIQRPPPIVFLFPGPGRSLSDLVRLHSLARLCHAELVDSCLDRFSQHLNIDLGRWIADRTAELSSPPHDSASRGHEGGNTEASPEGDILPSLLNSVLFTCQYTLARFLIRCALVPRSLIGYGFGELTAACLAEVFSIEDAINLIAASGKMFDSIPIGSMIDVPVSVTEIAAMIGQEVDIAAVTGEKRCIISGKTADIERFEIELGRSGIKHLRVNCSKPLHSRWVSNLVPELTSLLRGVRLNAPAIPIYTTRTGRKLTTSQAKDPGFWASQITGKLWFDAAVTNAGASGERLFLEVGTVAELCELATLNATTSSRARIFGVPLMQQTSLAPREAFLETMADLWRRGVNLDWTRMLPPRGAQKISLPTYPFSRTRFWVTPPRHSEDAAKSERSRVAGYSSRPGAGAIIPPDASGPETAVSRQNGGRPDPSEVRSRLSGIVSAAIGVSSVEESMSFRELGGTSLTSLAVARQIKKHLGVTVRPDVIYGAESLVALTRLVRDSYEDAHDKQPATSFLRLPPNSVQRLFVRGFTIAAHLQATIHPLRQRFPSDKVEEALREVTSEYAGLRSVLAKTNPFCVQIRSPQDYSPCLKEIPPSGDGHKSFEELFLQAGERDAVTAFLQDGPPPSLVVVSNSLLLDSYSHFDLVNRLIAEVSEKKIELIAQNDSHGGTVGTWQRWRYSRSSCRRARLDLPFWLNLCETALKLPVALSAGSSAMRRARLKFALDPGWLVITEDGSRDLFQKTQQLVAGAIGKAMAALGQRFPLLIHVEGRDSMAGHRPDPGNYCFHYPLLLPAFRGESNSAYMASIRDAFARIPSAGFTYHQLRFSAFDTPGRRLPPLTPVFEISEPVLLPAFQWSQEDTHFCIRAGQTATPLVRSYIGVDTLEIDMDLPNDSSCPQFLTTFEAYCAETLDAILQGTTPFYDTDRKALETADVCRNTLSFPVGHGFLAIVGRSNAPCHPSPLIVAIGDSNPDVVEQLKLLSRAKVLQPAAFLRVLARGTATMNSRIHALWDALRFVRAKQDVLNIDVKRIVFACFGAAYTEAFLTCHANSESRRADNIENGPDPAAVLLWHPRPPFSHGLRSTQAQRGCPLPADSYNQFPIFCFIDPGSEGSDGSWTSRLLKDITGRAPHVHLTFAPDSLATRENVMTAQLRALLWPEEIDAFASDAHSEESRSPGLSFGDREPEYIARLSSDSSHFSIVYANAYSQRAELASRLFNEFATYQIFLPPSYFSNPAARFPCIYWLHGLQSCQLEGDFVARFILEAIRNGHCTDWIAIFPNLPDWSLKREPTSVRSLAVDFIVTELIPYIDNTYRTIPGTAGRAVEGFSGGAELALQLCSTDRSFSAMSLLAPPPIPSAAFTSDRVQNVSSIPSVRLVAGTADSKYEEVRNLSSRLASFRPHEVAYFKDVSHEPEKLYEAFEDEHPLSFFSRAFGKAALGGPHIEPRPVWAGQRNRFPRRRVLVYGSGCIRDSMFGTSEMAKLLNHLAGRGYDLLESSYLIQHGLTNALEELGCRDKEAIDLGIISNRLAPEPRDFLNLGLTLTWTTRNDHVPGRVASLSAVVIFHPELFLCDRDAISEFPAPPLSDFGELGPVIQKYAALAHILLPCRKADSATENRQVVFSAMRQQCANKLHVIDIPSITALINTGRLARFLDDAFA